MSALISGILSQHATAHSLLNAQSVSPQAAATAGSSASDSATISANDFLTLLVTEMKNQDPTANTDPNEYINQLVQVNSLEQLISINQTLTSDTSQRRGIVRDPSIAQFASVPGAAQPGATAPSQYRPLSRHRRFRAAPRCRRKSGCPFESTRRQIRVAQSLTLPSHSR